MANRNGMGHFARTPHSPDPTPLHPAFVAPPIHPGYQRILPFSAKAMGIGFGQILRATRLRVALSQEELAARAGMYRTNISLIEVGGRGNVRVATVCILAHALRINPGELMPILFQPNSTPVTHKALPLKPPSVPHTHPKPQNPHHPPTSNHAPPSTYRAPAPTTPGVTCAAPCLPGPFTGLARY